MKLEDVQVLPGTVRRRKELLKKARMGKAGVRTVRTADGYRIGVHTAPESVIVCSPEFSDKKLAEGWCRQKTLLTPPTRSVAAA